MAQDGGRAFSSTEALRFGWDKTRANVKPLLILGAIGAAFGLLNRALMTNGGHGHGFLGSLVLQALQAALMMVYIRVGLKLCEDRPLDLSQETGLLNGFLTYLLASVLYCLIVTAGMVLLVVPGIIWALQFCFAPFLVVDRKLTDPFDALHESSRLTSGVKGQLLTFGLLMFGVNLLGALALGIGLILTVPTTVIATAYVLRRLQERSAQLGQARPEPNVVSPQVPTTSH